MEGRWTKRRRPDQPPTDRETMRELNELQQELRRLAAERDVVILAHNYQRPEVQGAADHTGDSLELARIAQKLSLIHISEPTRLGMISYAVFCLKKKKK